MVKITKAGEQYKINLPLDIMELTRWDENTELLVIPFIQDPKEPIDENTPIILREIKKSDKIERRKK